MRRVNSPAATRRVLICALVLPEFDREAGSKRVFDLIDLFREAGYAVTFLAREPSGDHRYVRILQQRGVLVYQGFDREATELLMFGRFDLAVFCSWHVAEEHVDTLRSASPQTRIIVDAVDLHWLRNLRRHFLPRLASEQPARDAGEEPVPDFPWLMIRELGSYVSADAVLTVSEKEARIMNDMIGSRVTAHTVPLIEDAAPSSPSVRERRGIVFVGNFRHEPNLDAARFFCEEVVPRLSSTLLTRHPICIVGNEPTEEVLKYARKSPFIRVVGWVPSLLPYLQSARVSVVPLRFGAGTKGKLLQALMAGTPVVATSIGVEGLDLAHGRHLLVADDAESFAASVEQLIRDEAKWTRLVRQGGAEIVKRHGREAVRARLLEAIAATSLTQGQAPHGGVDRDGRKEGLMLDRGFLLSGQRR